jgi:hypothetical protein
MSKRRMNILPEEKKKENVKPEEKNIKYIQE